MKKFKKYLGLLFTLAILLLTPTIDAKADWFDEGGGGNEGPGGTRDDVKEGATSLKTGYMIWVADENGNKLSNIVFVSTYGNVLEPNNADTRVRRCLINRLGQGCTHEIYGMPVDWGMSPFDVGAESAIESFVTSPYGGFESGGEYIMEIYLGMSKSARQALLDRVEAGENIHLCFESFALMGIYDGSDYSGFALLGSVNHFAAYMDSNNWVAAYSHEHMPNNVYLTVPWGSLRVVTNPSGRHSSAELLELPKRGWGFCSYNLKPGDKTVIKVYINKNGNLEDTVYTTCGKEYEIKDEGSYKLSRWAVGETKTTLTGKQQYDTIQRDISPITRHGTSTQRLTLTEAEKVIVIEYKENLVDSAINEDKDALKAFELNFVYGRQGKSGESLRAANNSWKPSTFYDTPEKGEAFHKYQF